MKTCGLCKQVNNATFASWCWDCKRLFEFDFDDEPTALQEVLNTSAVRKVAEWAAQQEREKCLRMLQNTDLKTATVWLKGRVARES